MNVIFVIEEAINQALRYGWNLEEEKDSVASLIWHELADAGVLIWCDYPWETPGSDHVHECWSANGHPFRHTCRVTGCRSWRPGEA